MENETFHCGSTRRHTAGICLGQAQRGRTTDDCIKKQIFPSEISGWSDQVFWFSFVKFPGTEKSENFILQKKSVCVCVWHNFTCAYLNERKVVGRECRSLGLCLQHLIWRVCWTSNPFDHWPIWCSFWLFADVKYLLWES